MDSFGNTAIHANEAAKTQSLLCVAYLLYRTISWLSRGPTMLNPAIAYRLTEPTNIRGTSVSSVPGIRP